MKFKIVFAIVILCANALPAEFDDSGEEIPPIRQPAALRDNLLKLLNDIIKRMHMPIPSLGLPILDPIQMDERMELNLEQSDLGVIRGSFEKLTVVGLQTMIPVEVNFSLAGYPFLFNITIPRLQVTGSYSLDAMMGNILGVTGQGDFNITITNIKVYLAGRLRYNSNVWTMPELDLLMSLEKLDTLFNGLYGGKNEYEDFINYALSELGADILNEMFPDVQQTFIDLVISVAEGALEGKTAADLMNLANGNIELPPLEDE